MTFAPLSRNRRRKKRLSETFFPCRTSIVLLAGPSFFAFSLRIFPCHFFFPCPGPRKREEEQKALSQSLFCPFATLLKKQKKRGEKTLGTKKHCVSQFPGRRGWVRTWEETYCTYASTFLQFHEVPCSHLLGGETFFFSFLIKLGQPGCSHTLHMPPIYPASHFLLHVFGTKEKGPFPPLPSPHVKLNGKYGGAISSFSTACPTFSQLLKGIKTAYARHEFTCPKRVGFRKS